LKPFKLKHITIIMGTVAASQRSDRDESHQTSYRDTRGRSFRHGVFQLPHRRGTSGQRLSIVRRMHSSARVPVVHVRIHHVHHYADHSSADLEGEDWFRNGPEAHPPCGSRRNAVFRFLAYPRISEQKSIDNLRRRILYVYPDIPSEPTGMEEGIIATKSMRSKLDPQI